MAVKLSTYSKIKNNYCICYFGRANEYLLQLKLLRKRIELKYPEINLFIGCKDEVVNLLNGDNKVILLSSLKVAKFTIAHIREIRTSSEFHPIERFCKESFVDFTNLQDISESPTRVCHICPGATYPSSNLTDSQITYFKSYAKNRGFEVKIGGRTESSGWVIGPENEFVFGAAANGVRTTLVSTGLGTEFFQRMFPKIEICDVKDI